MHLLTLYLYFTHNKVKRVLTEGRFNKQIISEKKRGRIHGKRKLIPYLKKVDIMKENTYMKHNYNIFQYEEAMKHLFVMLTALGLSITPGVASYQGQMPLPEEPPAGAGPVVAMAQPFPAIHPSPLLPEEEILQRLANIFTLENPEKEFRNLSFAGLLYGYDEKKAKSFAKKFEKVLDPPEPAPRPGKKRRGKKRRGKREKRKTIKTSQMAQ